MNDITPMTIEKTNFNDVWDIKDGSHSIKYIKASTEREALLTALAWLRSARWDLRARLYELGEED